MLPCLSSYVLPKYNQSKLFLPDKRKQPQNIKMTVDPTDIEHLFNEGKKMKKSSRAFYTRTWMEFVEMTGISKEVEPTFEHFMDYFVTKREKFNATSSTLRSCYSALNYVYQQLYDEKLQVCIIPSEEK